MTEIESCRPTLTPADLTVYVDCALDHAQTALEVAESIGARTDCLRAAVTALEGALRNLEHGDKEVPT